MLERLHEVITDLVDCSDAAARIDHESHVPSMADMQEKIRGVQDKLYRMTETITKQRKEIK